MKIFYDEDAELWYPVRRSPDIEAVQLDYRAYLRKCTRVTAAIIIGLDALAVVAVLLLVK